MPGQNMPTTTITRLCCANTTTPVYTNYEKNTIREPAGTFALDVIFYTTPHNLARIEDGL